MSYTRKIMRLDLSAEKPASNGYYYKELPLPAKDYEIRDAMQQLRAIGREDRVWISFLGCEDLPELENVRLDSPTLDELNFFAKRLASMTDENKIIFDAVIRQVIPDNPEGEIVSMTDLINSTYGLDGVMVASNIYNDEQLGQFVIEEEINEDVASIPDNALYLLNRKQIGKLQREIDGGVYVNGFYVVAGDYEMPKVYDGITLPHEELSEWFAFRLKVAKAPISEADETAGSAEWISLPIDKAEANAIAKAHNEGCIEDCVYFGFESSVLQITSEIFGDMADFDTLNALAKCMAEMSPSDQVKFKAVLTANPPKDVQSALNAAEQLDRYELSYDTEDEGEFFKAYLSRHMDIRLDRKWLDTLLTRNEGERLLQRLGASMTEYGVISACGRSLYEPVPYDEPETKELKTQAFTDEKLEVVEVLGQTALFTNGRVTEQELPEGLYKYDLREGENIGFASIEKSVSVNHGGTILVKSPLDFGGDEYVVFDDDSSPNFLGYELTPEEFMNTDFTQENQEEESEQQTGGMQL